MKYIGKSIDNNIAQLREHAMNTIAGLTFDEVTTASEAMDSAITKHSNSPSVLAGLAYLCGVAEGMNSNQAEMPWNDAKGEAVTAAAVRRVHKHYFNAISDELTERMDHLSDIMHATCGRYNDKQAENMSPLDSTDAQELLEYLELFADRVNTLYCAAVSIETHAEANSHAAQ